jgi:hypothetical protein
MNHLKPKVELLVRIIGAYKEAERSGVEDPGRIILETIRAQSKVKLFFESLSEQIK